MTTDQSSSWPRIDNDRLLELWRTLVEIESGSRDAEGLARLTEFMTTRLQDAGFQVSEEGQTACGAPHIVATRDGVGLPILLLGHLDTVWPPGTISTNPFRLDGGMLYGPGVADMKGGLAVMLEAITAMVEFGAPPSLKVILTADEELGSATGRSVVEKRATGCQAAFVVEPGRPGNHFVDRRRGSGVFTLEVTGRTAHAANNPDYGINAIDELAHQVLAFEKWRDIDRGTYLMAGTIQGGTARQVIADHAEALIDVRAATPEDLEELVAWLRDRENHVTVSGAKIKVRGDVTRPVMIPTQGTEELHRLAIDVGQDIGLDVTFTTAGGGSDGNFTASMGIPTIDGVGPVGHRMCSLDEAAEPETAAPRAALIAEMSRRMATHAD